ncbi:MAG TPA: hypothetical protein P5511_04490 [Candidatus Goldiibacteriota bacterium]|nr:hypothetical protein [Candidatus Goldiibacteriota bacterium]
MKKYIRKAEAARIFKVSVPTIRKFLKTHKKAVEGMFVNVEKIDEIITLESISGYKGRIS